MSKNSTYNALREHYLIYKDAIANLFGINLKYKGGDILVFKNPTVNPIPFQKVSFDNPLVCDADVYKDFKCSLVTGDTVINLINTVDGDAGLIEIIIDAVGGYTITLGDMFTKNLGGIEIDTTASADNFIGWRNVEGDIVYNVSTVVV